MKTVPLARLSVAANPLVNLRCYLYLAAKYAQMAAEEAAKLNLPISHDLVQLQFAMECQRVAEERRQSPDAQADYNWRMNIE